MPISSRLEVWGGRFLADGLARLLYRLTLALLLLIQIEMLWYTRVPVVALVVVGLIHVEICENKWFWPLVTFFIALGYFRNWMVIDNHRFLIAYWCLALAAVQFAQDRVGQIELSGRLMIGLTFLFAAIWRLMSPGFLDGSTLQFFLTTDTRFEDVNQLLGLMEPGTAETNRSILATLVADPRMGQGLLAAGATRGLAVFGAWWSFLLEGSIAIAFLTPAPGKLENLRHGLLLAFLFSVYAVVPVVGFGWIIAILGLSQCRERPRTAILYVTAVVFIWVATTPWPQLLGVMTG